MVSGDLKDQIGRLNRQLNQTRDKIFDDNFLLIQALRLKQSLKQRTQSGLDVDGNRFKPYSESYAKQENKGSVNDVTLTLTNDMLGSMVQEIVSNNNVRVFFSNNDAVKKARKHMEGDGVPVRNFFALSAENENDILAQYLLYVEKQVAVFNNK